ncbi:MAG: peroxiredoxin-like family protein [Actinomycetota bacterium]
MASLEELTGTAETEWLDGWTVGPTENEGSGLPAGLEAPDLALPDHAGRPRLLSEFWADQPALLMFWRHFGCGCGLERARRLKAEWADYLKAGLKPVIIGQGEPPRAAAYRSEQDLPCPVLCDPDHVAYRAYGIGQWPVERVLFDAPSEYWSHPHDLGVSFQNGRRAGGRPPVDDPWRAAAEFVIGFDGLVRLSYSYQYCEDFPDSRVLTTAARLS